MYKLFSENNRRRGTIKSQEKWYIPLLFFFFPHCYKNVEGGEKGLLAIYFNAK